MAHGIQAVANRVHSSLSLFQDHVPQERPFDLLGAGLRLEQHHFIRNRPKTLDLNFTGQHACPRTASPFPS